VLAILLVLGGGLGLWLSGAGRTGLPLAEPFLLTVEKDFEGQVRATGHVPSQEVRAALEARIAASGGTAEVTLARGDIPRSWGAGLMEMLGELAPLGEFRLDLRGADVTITGLADTPEIRAQVRAALAPGLPAGFSGTAEIGLGPRYLTVTRLRPVLDRFADCGPLQLPDMPALGYGLQDAVIVNGRFGLEVTRTALREAISALAGARVVRVEGEVLNASLCRIDMALPRLGPGGFDIRMGYGSRSGDNLSGRYRVNENPVIDIRLPEAVREGFLWVSIVDVKGVVFHLLPNNLRPGNALADLRAEAEGGWLRVAFALDEAGPGRLAFTVDDSTLGKSKILALHAQGRLFDELRPTSESVESYAEALAAAVASGRFEVRSIDTGILTTVR